MKISTFLQSPQLSFLFILPSICLAAQNDKSPDTNNDQKTVLSNQNQHSNYHYSHPGVRANNTNIDDVLGRISHRNLHPHNNRILANGSRLTSTKNVFTTNDDVDDESEDNANTVRTKDIRSDLKNQAPIKPKIPIEKPLGSIKTDKKPANKIDTPKKPFHINSKKSNKNSADKGNNTSPTSLFFIEVVITIVIAIAGWIYKNNLKKKQKSK